MQFHNFCENKLDEYVSILNKTKNEPVEEDSKLAKVLNHFVEYSLFNLNLIRIWHNHYLQVTNEADKKFVRAEGQKRVDAFLGTMDVFVYISTAMQREN